MGYRGECGGWEVEGVRIRVQGCGDRGAEEGLRGRSSPSPLLAFRLS